MKKYLLSIVSVAVVLLGLTSCSVPMMISYDTKIPAEWNKPVGVTKLGLINHTPDSLSNVGAEINHSLAERLSEDDYLDEITVLDSVIYAPMHSPEVNRLIHYLDVDCLASLDSLSLVMTGRNKEDKVAYINVGDFVSALLYVDPSVYSYGYIYGVVNMYLPNQSTPFASVNVKEHFDWESIAGSVWEASKNLPSMEEKIGHIIERTTDILKHKMVPYWRTTSRWVYVNEDKALTKAKKHLNSEEWDQAAAIWHEMYKNEDAYRKKALAAHNLFVYYEKISNPNEAIEWCRRGAANFKRCGATFSAGELLRYIPELEKRKEELKRLDQQAAAELN